MRLTRDNPDVEFLSSLVANGTIDGERDIRELQKNHERLKKYKIKIHESASETLSLKRQIVAPVRK